MCDVFCILFSSALLCVLSSLEASRRIVFLFSQSSGSCLLLVSRCRTSSWNSIMYDRCTACTSARRSSRVFERASLICCVVPGAYTSGSEVEVKHDTNYCIKLARRRESARGSAVARAPFGSVLFDRWNSRKQRQENSLRM